MPAHANHWLVKSEPDKYSWDDLVKDGWTYWDGVRNYEARNNLQSMVVGDRLLYYHSNKGTAVVGIAEVTREHYQDPTTEDERWCVVDIKPVVALERPVTLAEIKGDSRLQDMVVARRSRLSVSPVTPEEYRRVLELGGLVTPSEDDDVR